MCDQHFTKYEFWLTNPNHLLNVYKLKNKLYPQLFCNDFPTKFYIAIWLLPPGNPMLGPREYSASPRPLIVCLLFSLMTQPRGADVHSTLCPITREGVKPEVV